jgi:uridine monophosphate synthetase
MQNNTQNNTHNTQNNVNNIISSLIQNNCIKTGNFTLKSGQISKYYYDIKNIISYPPLLIQISELLYENILLSNIQFDILCAIPLGSLPITSYISQKYNIPMIVLRNSSKTYGTKSDIDGVIPSKDSKCIIIDDVITSGLSINNALLSLKDKINVVATAVAFNRQQCSTIDSNIPIISALNKTQVTRYNLQRIIKQKKSRFCFAADFFNDIQSFKNIINFFGPHIVICKIHWDLFKNIIKDQQTLDTLQSFIIQASIQHDFLIMEDRKFIDITNIVRTQYLEFSNWVDLITVHALVTLPTIKSISGAVIVANMSNTYSQDNNLDFSERAFFLASNAQDNVIGFVSQKYIQTDNLFFIMTPGISLQDNNNQDNYDQKYISIQKAKQDIKTDVFIIGRSILKKWKNTDDSDNSSIIELIKNIN